MGGQEVEISARDIATIFNKPYSETAPKLLGDQHEFLLQTLERYLKDTDGTLIVLGSGGQVLPYSRQYTEDGRLGKSNRDRVKGIIGDGRIILLDYVLKKDKGGLEMGREALEKMGFFDEGYFKEGKLYKEESIEPENLEPGTISYLLNDLQDNLRLDDEIATAIDANLSIHHASITRGELERVYREIFRVLRPGGLLHLGEGNVDMNYTEDKLIRVGQDLSSIIGMPILVTDAREGENYVKYSFFEPGKNYDDLPTITKEAHKGKRTYAPVKVTEEGLIILEANNPNEVFLRKGQTVEIANALRAKGYPTVITYTESIAMPLIDPRMEADVKKHINGVFEYYGAIRLRAADYSLTNKGLFDDLNNAVDYERSNAERGVVEYYMGEGKILAALKKTGFIVEQVVHHPTEPFYNIVAFKPKA